MTTDVNAEIAELKRKIEQVEGEIEQVKGEIEQVKAAQKWLHVESLTDEQSAAEHARAGDYANPKICPVDLLPTKLVALENQLAAKENLLVELWKKENLLLEKRRAARAPNGSKRRSTRPFRPSQLHQLALSPIIESDLRSHPESEPEQAPALRASPSLLRV